MRGACGSPVGPYNRKTQLPRTEKLKQDYAISWRFHGTSDRARNATKRIPTSKDTEWFLDMLGVMIELACPNTGLPPKEKAFITDLRRGLTAKLRME